MECTEVKWAVDMESIEKAKEEEMHAQAIRHECRRVDYHVKHICHCGFDWKIFK